MGGPVRDRHDRRRGAGLIAIDLLLGYLRRNDYSIFVIYRLAAAAAILIVIATEMSERAASKPSRRELAGAVADVGVLVPIAVALIVKNGLSATAVLLPAGLLYLAVAFIYRLPVPVQPLKAFGAIAIAKGLGSNEIAAGAILMGAIFLVLGQLRVLDLAARGFPKALIRGVQLTVGLLFLKIAWTLVTAPPKGFKEHALSQGWALPLALLVVVLAFGLRRWPITLALVGTGAVVMVVLAGDKAAFGPLVDLASPTSTAASSGPPSPCSSFRRSRSRFRQLVPGDGRRGEGLLRQARRARATRPLGDDLRHRKPARGRDLGNAGVPRRRRHDGPLRIRSPDGCRPRSDGRAPAHSSRSRWARASRGFSQPSRCPSWRACSRQQESCTCCCCATFTEPGTGPLPSSWESSASR